MTAAELNRNHIFIKKEILFTVITKQKQKKISQKYK